MTTTTKGIKPRVKYHPHAYEFVFEALRFTQKRLDRPTTGRSDEDAAHISGQELVEGIRELATKQFGLMTQTVFRCWGIFNTIDFGYIVFDMISRGDMRKTARDQLIDFSGIYDFETAFDTQYQLDLSNAFRRSSN